MPLAQLAEPWPKMELVQLETENGQSTTEDGVTSADKLSGPKREPPPDPAVTVGPKRQTNLCSEAQGFLLCVLALHRFSSVNIIL
ncbi:ribosomal protein S6 kinase alpha-1-like [Carassius gibelio]|uniref:ribosomal protein S6 kinase alpha-1-like n=1 Tax=Carassius gibelio TaxID=101364 RepID=UPI002279AEB1|nr:ribosomal protein S6 kinase alpha-1-like [Carassius gibelio]